MVAPFPFQLKIKTIAAGAFDGVDGCAVESQEGLAALRAFEVFLNHSAFFLSSMTITPVLSNLAFGVKLHPKAEILLCLAHGGLCRV